MSSQEISPSQEMFAGAVPAERSGAGIAPAGDAANVPLSPIPPDNDEGVPPSNDAAQAGVEAAGEVPSVPIDPQPFGVSPVRLTGRGGRGTKRLVTPQQAAASTRKLTAEQKLLILDTCPRRRRRVFMITEDGQRKEVELSPPAQPPAEMPTPVCAQGIVSTELADEVAPPPGVNGSHFTDERVRLVLSAAGVTVLLSPPKTPRYNGSEEAGIGSLKTRILHVAAVHGRIDHWTCDDVEAARIEANIQARPLGKNGPVPINLWESRSPVADAERLRFLQRLDRVRAEETQKFVDPQPGSRPAPDFELGAQDRATVARRATRRVLVELGYLFVRRIAN